MCRLLQNPGYKLHLLLTILYVQIWVTENLFWLKAPSSKSSTYQISEHCLYFCHTIYITCKAFLVISPLKLLQSCLSPRTIHLNYKLTVWQHPLARQIIMPYYWFKNNNYIYYFINKVV